MKPNAHRFSKKNFVIKPGDAPKLKKRSTEAGKELESKDLAKETLAADVSFLQASQEHLVAGGKRALLIILQGMDASGKDGTIKHIMSGCNPLSCRAYAFKAPTGTELQHHFLWRPMPFLPERGTISLFNRSYYEEVLVVRVHPDFLVPQNLPPFGSLNKLWKTRYAEINQFEETLTRHGTSVLKFFLHISPKEQKRRLIERLEDPTKHWKFNERDLVERKLWKEYHQAYEEAIEATSTEHAPWHVIPADDKWYARAAIADLIASHLDELDLGYPEIDEATRQKYAKLKAELSAEKD